MSLVLVTHVCKAAIRDRIILSILVLIALSACLSVFLASSALTEKDQFASVFTAGGLRLLGVLGLSVFVVFFIRRSMETKDIEFLLSRPISRVKFILSYAFAFSLLSILIASACGFGVYIISPHLFGAGHIVWALSVAIEFIIIANISFFFGLMLSSAATAVLSVLAFYVLSRMMGQILGILDAGVGIPAEDGLEMILQVVSIITPRLDLLGQTSWLIYGVNDFSSLYAVVAQTLGILCLVLCASLIDLVKRQF